MTTTFDPLRPSDDETLHWRQPEALHWRFLLAAAPDRTLGTLEFTSWDRAHARAQTALGTWEFAYVGFWAPRVIARRDGAEVAALEIASAWRYDRATLTAPDGRRIATWEMTSFLRGRAEWRDDRGECLISYRSGTDEGGVASWLRTQCRVDFTPAGFDHPDRDLLLTIGWYITVLVSNPAI